MSTHKKIDKIAWIAMLLGVLVTVLFMNAESLGIQAAEKVMGYEERLFDESAVHTIDIVIDDWEGFLSTCQSEEYSACSVLIDGEAYTNVGIRGKGNTSLSTVSSMDSDRYSFKIEFDQYDSTKSYYGLDKLCLNNVIQDNTYMKDFLVYQMMAEFGVDAPLCSYVYITVNGEDWGLYLAVEGVEDAFLQRNYGNDYGELYKPDSMSMGGGRGNGREFDMEDVDFSQFEAPDMSNMPWGSGQQDMGNMPQEGEFPDMGGMPQMPEGMQMPGMSGEASTENEESTKSERKEFAGKVGGGFGMGSDDVKLQYIDDNASSYANIFDNAKTDVSDVDAARLIASLKVLGEGENVESVVDIEEVIRYFVVHNFVVNGDSYTGSMIHNYYLYEEDGLLSMIPWDYNLAFGTFQSNNANSAVNDPIDSPVSGGMEDRPMVNWIFENEEYTEAYHEYFSEFIEEFFNNGTLAELIDSTAELIAPYVEQDPTKFCTYEEFETGVTTIREFCLLRAESVSGQLSGTIPSTSEGQAADSSTLIDASGLVLSDMGTMNMGRDEGGREGMGSVDSFEEGFEGFGGNNSAGADFGGVPGSRWEGSENRNGAKSEASGFLQMPSENQQRMPEMSTNRQTVGFGEQQHTSGSGVTPVIVLAGSFACLLAGLLVAWRYRR